ncbi:MAG: type II secretion system F family protein [Ilumatobacteraceae bacterium]
MASAVRSGQSLTHAIVTTERSWAGSPVVPSVAHAVSRGRNLSAALDEVPASPATPRGLAVGVLRACARVGGPAASAIERVADTLHARGAERAERQAASAQARLSARVLTVVPFAVVTFLALTDPSVRSALSSPAGAACLGTGAVLNLLGWWWMRRMIGVAS